MQRKAIWGECVWAWDYTTILGKNVVEGFPEGTFEERPKGGERGHVWMRGRPWEVSSVMLGLQRQQKSS